MGKCCILIVIAILIVTCGNNVSQPSPSSGGGHQASTPASNKSIRDINFRNFTYDWYPSEYRGPGTAESIVLEDGAMNVGSGEGTEPRRFFLSEVVYGDLTQDGIEEAVVVLGAITSGTARQFSLLVYTLQGAKPERLWVLETGDRWDFGLYSVQIVENQLVVQIYKPSILEFEGKKHNLSSASSYLRDVYGWNGKGFVKLSRTEVPVSPDDKNPWVSK